VLLSANLRAMKKLNMNNLAWTLLLILVSNLGAASKIITTEETGTWSWIFWCVIFIVHKCLIKSYASCLELGISGAKSCLARPVADEARTWDFASLRKPPNPRVYAVKNYIEVSTFSLNQHQHSRARSVITRCILSSHSKLKEEKRNVVARGFIQH